MKYSNRLDVAIQADRNFSKKAEEAVSNRAILFHFH